MNEREIIKLNISHTDEYGRKTKLKRKYYVEKEDEIGTVQWYLEQFKYFLNAIGFSDILTDYLIFLESGEKVVDKDGDVILERKKL